MRDTPSHPGRDAVSDLKCLDQPDRIEPPTYLLSCTLPAYSVLQFIIIDLLFVPQYATKQHHKLQVNKKVQFID